MARAIKEDEIEQEALTQLKSMGYTYLFGGDIAPDGINPMRSSYSDVLLHERLMDSVERLNPKAGKEAYAEAVRKLTAISTPHLIENNERFHKMMTEGVPVECKKDGKIVWENLKVIDFDNPKNNDFVAVNQFTVEENGNNRRADIVLFVNGLPLVLIELKNPADVNATIWAAYNQLETYKLQIPSLFIFNEILVISDGLVARHGTLTSGKEWFLPWKTVDGKELAPKNIPEMFTLLEGMFDKARLLDLVRSFVVYEKTKKTTSKKMALYHQYHAVNKAVAATVKATAPKGDKRCGVVWHTQGSGKSLSMVFYTGKLVLALNNPTIVVLTDRNDLDEQLFKTFSNCHSLLRQKPTQVQDRKSLRKQLQVASGGVVFTTIQKFLPEVKGDTYPLLSDRKNIVVIADEAHRSQYDFIDGFARHMRDALPNASFIGYSGTPIEKSDRSTMAVFGDYIDIYDIQQAVEDGATVRIFYEGRLAKIELKPSERPTIDKEFTDITEGEEEKAKERLKSKWARVEALVGSEKRIKLIAKDIVNHFEQRLSAMDGKAMVVCMSRRICVELYNEIVKIRPDWHNDDDDKGFVKVVITGSATDELDMQPHIRNKQRREHLAERMKNATSSLKMVIVRDMWLTGFDVPSLHTMYVDKPMQGHGLMQAIARVNRVFKDKQGGLVVDYIGFADRLKEALANYTTGDRAQVGIQQSEAIAIMLEKYEIVTGLLHGFDYSPFFKGTPRQRITTIPMAMEHIFAQKDGKKRYLQGVVELSKAFALAVPSDEALGIKDEIGFFQTVRSAMVKTTESTPPDEEYDTAIRQIVSRAIVSDKVIDIFAAAGLKTPDISILSDEFMAEVKSMPQKNLAFETLKKLINDEIRVRSSRNLVQGRSFAAMLDNAVRKYQNKSIQTAEVITELIELAKKMKEASKRGDDLHLNEDELAFYDALETNDSAVKVLGDKTLTLIAKEVADTIKKNVSIDWTLKESVQAKLRLSVKKVLRKYGYPPDKQESATRTVLMQAELLCTNWEQTTAVV